MGQKTPLVNDKKLWSKKSLVMSSQTGGRQYKCIRDSFLPSPVLFTEFVSTCIVHKILSKKRSWPGLLINCLKFEACASEHIIET